MNCFKDKLFITFLKVKGNPPIPSDSVRCRDISKGVKD